MDIDKLPALQDRAVDLFTGILDEAREIARCYGFPETSPSHLLMALTTCPEAAWFFAERGVDPASIGEAIRNEFRLMFLSALQDPPPFEEFLAVDLAHAQVRLHTEGIEFFSEGHSRAALLQILLILDRHANSDMICRHFLPRASKEEEELSDLLSSASLKEYLIRPDDRGTAGAATEASGGSSDMIRLFKPGWTAWPKVGETTTKKPSDPPGVSVRGLPRDDG